MLRKYPLGVFALAFALVSALNAQTITPRFSTASPTPSQDSHSKSKLLMEGTANRGGRSACSFGGFPTAALVSPDVHPDRTVTFRFRAPEATQVSLVGEINQGKGPQPMSKDDSGLWTITVGPLPPEIWIYNFRIQGIDVIDPSNPAVKPVPPGEITNSFVEVPGESLAFYDARPVPHGDVRMVMYESKAMGVTRWVWIYTPPGYDQTRAKYPVLYLLHGNGEDQSGCDFEMAVPVSFIAIISLLIVGRTHDCG